MNFLLNYDELIKLEDINGINSIVTFVEKLYIYHNKTDQLTDQIKLINRKLNIDIINILSLVDNINNIIDELFIHHYNKDTKIVSKEYMKYYNNPLLIKWLIKLIDKNYYKVFDGNMKINCFIKEISNYLNKNSIYEGNQENIDIYKLVNIDLSFNNKSNYTITNNNLLLTGMNNYDLIFFDIPNDIHNMTFARCCDKIKKLKIRGTKVETLLLQLVLLSLNKNGMGIVILPDNILFNDTQQNVLTRKYLLDNFNLKKVIQINDNLYYHKNYNNSILIIENKNKTSNIEFSKIQLKDGEIIETDLINIDISQIEDNNYILYSNMYLINNNINSISELIKIDDIITIKDINSNIFIGLEKTYKTNFIKLINKDEINEYETIITPKNNIIKPEIFYDYIKYILSNNINLITYGKTKIFDIDKIKNLDIIKISDNIQEQVIKQKNYNNNIIDLLNKAIDNYKLNKINKFKTLLNNDLYELVNIVKINEYNKDTNYISILKNGINSGNINYIYNQEFLNNSYYLSLNNDNFNLEYIYYYLFSIEDKIKDLSNLTQQNSLNQTKLLSLKIPYIDLDNQLKIVKYCNDCDKYINDLNKQINDINNMDLFNFI